MPGYLPLCLIINITFSAFTFVYCRTAAGDLGCLEDSFTTMSGRNVALRFYSEHNNVSKLSYAVESLKRAMKWDEDTFGLEYDLDLFNVVAVESFNMGAMENKSLNVFNTSCVLADPKTSSDANYFVSQSHLPFFAIRAHLRTLFGGP